MRYLPLTADDRAEMMKTIGAKSVDDFYGDVPVSAVRPSLLLRSLEIERASHSREKPPLLPPPVSANKPTEVKP